MSDEAAEKSGFRGLRMWFWSYVVTGLLWVGIRLYGEHQQHLEHRRALNRDLQEMREAVRRGEGGEAFQRLFGDEQRRPRQAPAPPDPEDG